MSACVLLLYPAHTTQPAHNNVAASMPPAMLPSTPPTLPSMGKYAPYMVKDATGTILRYTD